MAIKMHKCHMNLDWHKHVVMIQFRTLSHILTLSYTLNNYNIAYKMKRLSITGYSRELELRNEIISTSYILEYKADM